MFYPFVNIKSSYWRKLQNSYINKIIGQLNKLPKYYSYSICLPHLCNFLKKQGIEMKTSGWMGKACKPCSYKWTFVNYVGIKRQRYHKKKKRQKWKAHTDLLDHNLVYQLYTKWNALQLPVIGDRHSDIRILFINFQFPACPCHIASFKCKTSFRSCSKLHI